VIRLLCFLLSSAAFSFSSLISLAVFFGAGLGLPAAFGAIARDKKTGESGGFRTGALLLKSSQKIHGSVQDAGWDGLFVFRKIYMYK